MKIETNANVNVVNSFMLHKTLGYDEQIKELRIKYNINNVIRITNLTIDSINNIDNYKENKYPGLINDEYHALSTDMCNPGEYLIKYQIQDIDNLTHIHIFIFKK